MWLSAGEMVVVGILALLVFGPEKLPELARQVARFVSQLQNIVGEVKRNVDEVIREDQNHLPEPRHIGLSPAEQEHERYMLAKASELDAPAEADAEADAEVDAQHVASAPSQGEGAEPVAPRPGINKP